VVPRFAAEPPHEPLPYGRWAERLREEFLAACLAIDAQGEDVGEPGDISWHPDRTWHGHTYLPATATTSTGLELFGHVRFRTPEPGREPEELLASADFTSETAAEHPEWSLDLCDEVIGTWVGERSATAAITLVWGRALRGGGAIVTAELADLVVDQCPLQEGRFTLIAPDDYRGDFLDVKLFSERGEELAAESLYEDDADED
jgi:hypothetical protein